MRELRDYPVSKVCSVLNIKLSHYYYRKRNPVKESVYDEEDAVKNIFFKHNGSFGRRPIKRELEKEKISISEYKISKILKKLGLRSKYGRRKCRNVYTSANVKDEYVQANLFKSLTKEEKKKYILSMDFTEVKLKSGKCYTCGAIDINGKVLVAELCGCKNDSESACRTVEMAIANYGVPYMITTDRGSPFVSKSFHDMLKRYGIRHSMSRPGTPGDNCMIETFWKSMKTEIGKVSHMSTAEYKAVMAYYVHYYNTERPHSTLGYCTPISAYHNKYCH